LALGVWQFFPQLSLQTKNGTSKNNKPSKKVICVLPKINFQSETRANAKAFSLFRTKNNLLNQKEKTAEAKKEHFNFFLKKT
jgi:hypothetical protein